jgi:hypothetical protein
MNVSWNPTSTYGTSVIGCYVAKFEISTNGRKFLVEGNVRNFSGFYNGYVSIRAIANNGSKSAWSPSVSGYFTKVTASNLTYNSAKFTWTDQSSNLPTGPIGIQISPNGGGSWLEVATDILPNTVYTVGNLSQSTSYSVRVVCGSCSPKVTKFKTPKKPSYRPSSRKR